MHILLVAREVTQVNFQLQNVSTSLSHIGCRNCELSCRLIKSDKRRQRLELKASFVCQLHFDYNWSAKLVDSNCDRNRVEGIKVNVLYSAADVVRNCCVEFKRHLEHQTRHAVHLSRHFKRVAVIADRLGRLVSSNNSEDVGVPTLTKIEPIHHDAEHWIYFGDEVRQQQGANCCCCRWQVEKRIGDQLL